MIHHATRLVGAVVSTFLCLAVATEVVSLTVEYISLERMARESHTIVYGTVVSSYSQWEDRNIFTYTTVRVKEPVKGETGQAITVKQLGGQVGDVGQEVDGTPELRHNEDVVLFLTQWKGSYWIHSIVLGKFSVVSEGNTLVAFNDLNNIGLIDPVTRQEIREPNRKSNHIPLQSLLNEVRSFVNN